VRELNSRKSPTARNILFSADSRELSGLRGMGVEGGLEGVTEDMKVSSKKIDGEETGLYGGPEQFRMI
jgi:hypothetical protein